MLNCGTVSRFMFVEWLVVGEDKREIYSKWPKRLLGSKAYMNTVGHCVKTTRVSLVIY
jgi:hypothetical protein